MVEKEVMEVMAAVKAEKGVSAAGREVMAGGRVSAAEV